MFRPGYFIVRQRLSVHPRGLRSFPMCARKQVSLEKAEMSAEHLSSLTSPRLGVGRIAYQFVPNQHGREVPCVKSLTIARLISRIIGLLGS
jgi:hypothetical protein